MRMAPIANATRGESVLDGPLFVSLSQSLQKHIADANMDPQRVFPAVHRAPPGLEPPKVLELGRLLVQDASQHDNEVAYYSDAMSSASSGAVCSSHMAQLPAGSQEIPRTIRSERASDEPLKILETLTTPPPTANRFQKQQPRTRSKKQSGNAGEPPVQTVPEDRGGRQTKGKGKNKSAQGSSDAQDNRWWTRPQLPLLCPLTKFPICLLPYPPFKLRVDSSSSSPHKLVDGKFLAMKLIASGNVPECGRELQEVDLNALDEYIQRCKLGPFRPGRATALAKEAASSEDASRRTAAAQELNRFRISARIELGKLRRIQENRLVQAAQNQKNAWQGQ